MPTPSVRRRRAPSSPSVYATALNGSGTNTVGIGTTLSTVAQQFTQGNVSTTENPMDLAINGAGFFQVSDGRSPVTYTRNGQFKIDREGFIVNNGLERLMGYAADGNGVIQTGQAVPLQLPTGGIDPEPDDPCRDGGQPRCAQGRHRAGRCAADRLCQCQQLQSHLLSISSPLIDIVIISGIFID